MTQVAFDRRDMKAEGDQVKNDVYYALIEAQGVKMEPEKVAEFTFTALTCFGLVVRVQLLEAMLESQKVGQFNENSVDKAIGLLCRALDIRAAQLGNQLELITEVKFAPPGRH